MSGAGGSPTTVTAAAMLLAGGSAYALLSGADFGGGIWDLLAGRGERGARLRELIDTSMTPVWEANHVWLVYLLVILWTAFPPAFSAIMTALFVPLSASALGIVLRGIGFAFRHEVRRFRSRQLAGALFAGASLATPFFLGTVVGAIVSGRVPARPRDDLVGAWVNPTSMLTGSLFVLACAYVSAVYLVGDAARRGEAGLVRAFERRAAVAAVATGGLAAATLAWLSRSAPRVFANLTGRALPLVALSVAAGLAVLVAIWRHRYRGVRALAGLAVAAVLWGWGLAQYPELVPGAYTLRAASAPNASLLAVLAILGIAAVTVGPAFAVLYRLPQRDALTAHASAPDPPGGAGGRDDPGGRGGERAAGGGGAGP